MEKTKRPPLKKSDIVWNDSENYDCTHSATHGLYGTRRGIFDKYEGNSALCNRNYGISDGGPYLPISEVPKNSDYKSACKRCQKIYDKLPD